MSRPEHGRTDHEPTFSGDDRGAAEATRRRFLAGLRHRRTRQRCRLVGAAGAERVLVGGRRPDRARLRPASGHVLHGHGRERLDVDERRPGKLGRRSGRLPDRLHGHRPRPHGDRRLGRRGRRSGSDQDDRAAAGCTYRFTFQYASFRGNAQHQTLQAQIDFVDRVVIDTRTPLASGTGTFDFTAPATRNYLFRYVHRVLQTRPPPGRTGDDIGVSFPTVTLV